MKAHFYNITSSSLKDKCLEENSLIETKLKEEADYFFYGGTFLDIPFEHLNEVRLIRPLNEKASLKVPEEREERNLLFKETFSGEELQEVVEKIEKKLEEIDNLIGFGDLKHYLQLISLELVQNALIFQRENSLRGKVTWSLQEFAESYGIVVTDPFGRLTRHRFLQKISRVIKEKTYEQKKSGAGLGLFMVLNSSDIMKLNVKKNERTEICCIIAKHKRLKDFKSKQPTLLIEED